MTDSITYALTGAQCKQVAAIKFAASPPKDGRIVLESIRIKFDSDGFEAMATNSYMIAWRTFVVGNKDSKLRRTDAIQLLEGDASDMISVNAVELSDALITAAKQSPLPSAEQSPFVKIEMTKDLITISTRNSSATIHSGKCALPKSVDDEVIASAPEKGAEYSGVLPAFSTTLMALLIKSTGYTYTNCPVFRFLTTAKHGTGDAHLKPIRIELLEGTNSEWNAILMPIRT